MKPVNPRIKELAKFEEFLKELLGRDGRIRNVKLRLQGLVEPASQGKAIVMQPRVRIVATAVDPSPPPAEKVDKPQLIRWSEKSDVGHVMVSPSGGTSRDQRANIRLITLRNELEMAQFSVIEGEWTERDLPK